jgi:hypothetical protein
MSITKVKRKSKSKSKSKSKKFSKNGKNKTMKKNINKKTKTMIGGWPKFGKNKAPKPQSVPTMTKTQHVSSQNFWKTTPMEYPNKKTHFVPPNAKARARAARVHSSAVSEARKSQPQFLAKQWEKSAAADAIQRRLQERAIPLN